jgi:hypothetical protein
MSHWHLANKNLASVGLLIWVLVSSGHQTFQIGIGLTWILQFIYLFIYLLIYVWFVVFDSCHRTQLQDWEW